MSDRFETRLHSATVAGWWTLLIAAALFLLQWIMYLLIVPAQPGWILTLWGPGMTWQEVATFWFWFLAGFKIFMLLVAIILVWLTLWDRHLRKRTGSH